MNLHSSTINGILFLLLVAVVGGAAFNEYVKTQNQEKVFDEKILILQKQIAALQDELMSITGKSNQFALSLQEVKNREQVRVRTQDEVLTDAVAQITPSVVSIVVSKDVPLLEIVYRNPFGDDPFFRDFGFRIPTYRQKGVERRQVGAGTGFIVTGNGYILTNKHVVSDQNAEYTVLLSDGTQKSAAVSYRDPTNDIAILKIAGEGYPAVHLGNSSQLKLGQTVVAIGNALGEYNNSISVGIISGLNREIEASNALGERETLTGVIQTDAAINPGNSGGPLITTDGDVVGINVATVMGSNSISFAIPIDAVKIITKRILGI